MSHFDGWREYALLDAAAVQALDTGLAPAQAYLGVLGTTGLTAYTGAKEVAAVREGYVVFVVFVAGAAGAVGSVAGQLAKKPGAAKVIGSAPAAWTRPAAWSWTTASTRPSTTAAVTCPRSRPRQPRPASTSTSTTSAATTSRPPAARHRQAHHPARLRWHGLRADPRRVPADVHPGAFPTLRPGGSGLLGAVRLVDTRLHAAAVTH
ncbi:hypothetical protein [Streptomyces malaysiense]|uniref:hypothetical protein n=1 Tax=Streptomyces malaysiense TaxID=1428626 RepID=UPI001F0AE9A1|nr:hypothetical protein [Streptomyces malaysiense]